MRPAADHVQPGESVMGDGLPGSAAPWDVLRAELADVMRGQHSSRPKLPCKYCGQPTKSVYQVCLDHDDLPALETAGGSPDDLLLPVASSAAPYPSLQGRSRSGGAALAPTTTGG